MRRFLRALLLLALTAVLLYELGLFALVIWYKHHNPTKTAFMSTALQELRAVDPAAELHFEWVPYEAISASLKKAVVASEDSGFVDHDGVEWDAIRKAWQYNRKQAAQGRARRLGGSTITQQLAKNLFLSSRRSYLRKGQELILAYMMEAAMDKQRILELYLNVAQWGTRAFGAGAAARHYYRTTPDRLTSAQAARLAAMLPNPAYYDAHGQTTYLRNRTRTIQQRMRLVEIP